MPFEKYSRRRFGKTHTRLSKIHACIRPMRPHHTPPPTHHVHTVALWLTVRTTLIPHRGRDSFAVRVVLLRACIYLNLRWGRGLATTYSLAATRFSSQLLAQSSSGRMPGEHMEPPMAH